MAALPVRRGGRNTSLVNPTREFEDIYDRMGQLMNFAFGDMARAEMPWVPLADLSETEDAYVVKVELPGVGKDQARIPWTAKLVSTGAAVRFPRRPSRPCRRVPALGSPAGPADRRGPRPFRQLPQRPWRLRCAACGWATPRSASGRRPRSWPGWPSPSGGRSPQQSRP